MFACRGRRGFRSPIEPVTPEWLRPPPAEGRRADSNRINLIPAELQTPSFGADRSFGDRGRGVRRVNSAPPQDPAPHQGKQCRLSTACHDSVVTPKTRSGPLSISSAAAGRALFGGCVIFRMGLAAPGHCLRNSSETRRSVASARTGFALSMPAVKADSISYMMIPKLFTASTREHRTPLSFPGNESRVRDVHHPGQQGDTSSQ